MIKIMLKELLFDSSTPVLFERLNCWQWFSGDPAFSYPSNLSLKSIAGTRVNPFQLLYPKSGVTNVEYAWHTWQFLMVRSPNDITSSEAKTFTTERRYLATSKLLTRWTTINNKNVKKNLKTVYFY